MTVPPSALQARIEQLLGEPPLAFERVEGGYTPAARWLVRLSAKRVFAKVATTPLTAKLLRREAHVYKVVSGDFMPCFLGWSDHATEPILVIEDLSTAIWPPPWNSQRVAAVLQQIETMHQLSPATIPRFADRHPHFRSGWREVADDPTSFLALGMGSSEWLNAALPTLLAAEASCDTEGNAFTHCDIRSDNICITPGGVKLIDWPEACFANPKLDVGFWLPSLVAEGGPLPQHVLPDAPEIAAFVAGFFAARAGLADIPDAPNVRSIQRTQLRYALPWAIDALDLPRL